MVDLVLGLVGKNNVYRAIDLVEFDNRFEPAMNHIFGGVLVCSNLDIANQVCGALKILSFMLKTWTWKITTLFYT